MTNFSINTDQRRVGVSLTASIFIHLLMVVFIGMEQEDKPLPKKDTPKIMDVVLLDDKKSPSKKAPKEAKTVSNRDAVGGSTAEDKLTRQARSPMSGKQKQPKPTAPRQPKTPPVPKQDQRTRLLAKRGSLLDNSLNTKGLKKPEPKKPQPKKKPTPKVPLSNLMPSAMALSQLSRDFERERRMKQKLTREADIPINTKQAKYAPYAQALVRALEEQWRPGQGNYKEYAEEARRSLIKLTIERDGNLTGVEILRPSPIAQINESAVEAIQAAAPFKILPSSWGLDRVSFYLTFEVIEDKFVFRPM